MFVIKNNYYLYIENTNSIDLNCIKNSKKISIIYRNNKVPESIETLRIFRKKCKVKGFKLYISNNIKLLRNCGADGLYISSYNKKIYMCQNIELLGSAHSFKEINEKIKQGCKTIFLSRLFKTSYKNKDGNFGVVKFNLIINKYKIPIVPLGGIRSFNLNKLNMVNSNGLSLLSEIKKKPAISSRLF
jgi:thiamine monophosphate synthase|tara:strand:- start:228 stop:788 length:561 start_codon:yes stop_codon:yes gene_type:complete